MTTKTKSKKKQHLRNNEYKDIQDEFDLLYKQSKDKKNFKDLLTLITKRENILLAYRNIKRNKGSMTKGVNKTTIKTFEQLTEQQVINMVRGRLKNYKPDAIRRVEIPKSNGKTRPLGIPTFEDRIIQQCIKQVLEPILEAKFHPHSYGFRPNRSQIHAISRCASLVNMNGLHYVIDIDIKGFFDNVNHSKLIKQMWTLGIRDKNLICIIKKMLKAEVVGIGIPDKGTPQGGILSPLLSNIVLNELDWWISDQFESFKTRNVFKGGRKKETAEAQARSSKFASLRKTSNLKEMFIVRYADDFKIFCRTFESAQKTFIAVQQWLKERLDLEISPDKSKVINLKTSNSKFLGFEFKAVPKGNTRNKYVFHSRIEKDRKRIMFATIKQKLKDINVNRNVQNVTRYNGYILGVQNYYKYGTHSYKDFEELDYKYRRTRFNQLKKVIQKKNKSKSESFKKLYPNFKGKVMNVLGVSLFPLGHMKHENPRNFSQDTCNYTREGRTLVHSKQQSVNPIIIRYLLDNPIRNRSIEYNDNRITLYIAQKGKCTITGVELDIDTMECHHKKPRALGGDDRYNNLTLVTKEVHKLIHATTNETITKYLNELQLNEQQLEKVNALRKKVGNDIIVL